MKQNKKRLGGILATVCASALILGTSISFNAMAKEGGECSGPKENSTCLCSNSAACSDSYGCESGGGGVDWKWIVDKILDVIDIFT